MSSQFCVAHNECAKLRLIFVAALFFIDGARICDATVLREDNFISGRILCMNMESGDDSSLMRAVGYEAICQIEQRKL